MRRYSSNLAPEEEAINDKSHKPSPLDLSDKGLSYKDAGVDIQAGDALVEAIKPLARSTTRQGVLAGLGGFGALFDLKQAGYRDPILVAGTDGVGTKLKVAIEAARHQTVGIDLVAMCVNDLVVQGAEPLFFLDYFATGHLDVAIGAAVVSGIAEGCRQAGCALIGGETAEMPGMYSDGDYDLAGFAVGAVERQRLLTGDTIAPGDVLLGLAASGPHSNGYSLIRKIVQRSGLAYDDPAPFDTAETAESSLGAALLTPTRIYVSSCLAALKSEQIKGLIHITGGGFQENIPRILPAGTAVEIDCTAWTPPPVFHWLAEVGGVAAAEMMRTFNCGIGMIAVLPAEAEATLSATFRSAGEAVTRIGQVVAHDGDGPQVHLSDLAQAWSS